MCYLVDHDGSAFTICTVDTPDRTALDFDERKSLLDQVVGTLRFFPPPCAPEELAATFGFATDVSGNTRGTVTLTDISVQPCSLSGRPEVEVVGDRGKLALTQRSGGAAPNGDQTPVYPVALQNGAPRVAQVLLQWRNWCGEPPGPLQVRVRFSHWRTSLTASPASRVDPTVVPSCADRSAPSVLVVDYVRAHDQ